MESHAVNLRFNSIDELFREPCVTGVGFQAER